MFIKTREHQSFAVCSHHPHNSYAQFLKETLNNPPPPPPKFPSTRVHSVALNRDSNNLVCMETVFYSKRDWVLAQPLYAAAGSGTVHTCNQGTLTF